MPEMSGAQDQAEALILSRLPAVRKIAGRLLRRCPPWTQREELIAAGMVGLVQAAARYDPRLGWKFSTFSGRRIYGQMLDYLRDEDPLSRHARRRVKRQEDEAPRHVYLDQGGPALADRIIGHSKPTAERDVLVEEVRRAFGYLPPRMRVVMGLLLEGVSYPEIGARLHVTRGRVWQLEQAAHVKLRQYLGVRTRRV
jgi:RNA polymerase sigma factor (sigma-70 family)